MGRVPLKKLTGRELDIMQVIWSENRPIIATDILSKINDDKISIFTVQNNLKSLVRNGFIKINSFTIVNKSNTREYVATISADEYAVECFKSNFPRYKKKEPTLSELMLSLLKVESDNSNDEELEKIEKLIDEERKKLKGK